MNKSNIRPYRIGGRCGRKDYDKLVYLSKKFRVSKSSILELALENFNDDSFDKLVKQKEKKHAQNQAKRDAKRKLDNSKANQLFDVTARTNTHLNDLNNQFRNYGNNLNQVARSVNQGNSINDPQANKCFKVLITYLPKMLNYFSKNADKYHDEVTSIQKGSE